MVVIHKIITYKKIIDLNSSRAFEKKNLVLKEFLADPSHKTASFYKMLQLKNAFISNKAQLGHFQKPFSIQMICFGHRQKLVFQGLWIHLVYISALGFPGLSASTRSWDRYGHIEGTG